MATKKPTPPAEKESGGQDETKQLVKKKRNRPDLAKFGFENAEPGDNSRYLRYALASWDLPPIDISDPKQVEQRIQDYFLFCVENDRKPQMVGMANWLGVSRETVHTWMTGTYRAETHTDTIKKAVDLIHELWVDYMQNGKINPASGIFLGKNMFGYKDVQDVVVTPNNPLGDVKDPDRLMERYKQDVPEVDFIEIDETE